MAAIDVSCLRECPKKGRWADTPRPLFFQAEQVIERLSTKRDFLGHLWGDGFPGASEKACNMGDYCSDSSGKLAGQAAQEGEGSAPRGRARAGRRGRPCQAK